jgi:hypothetical protein
MQEATKMHHVTLETLLPHHVRKEQIRLEQATVLLEKVIVQKEIIKDVLRKQQNVQHQEVEIPLQESPILLVKALHQQSVMQELQALSRQEKRQRLENQHLEVLVLIAVAQKVRLVPLREEDADNKNFGWLVRNPWQDIASCRGFTFL